MRNLYWRFSILLCLLAIVSGCKTGDELAGVHECADVPPGSVPAEHGTYACQWQQLQQARAERDYFVIYDNEWRFGEDEDGTRLGPFGMRHLEELAVRLPHEPYAIVINKTEDAALDQTRRAVVVSYLQQKGLPQADSRVVVGRGHANGLYGLESPQIGTGFLGTGGRGRSRGGGGRGGFGGGGLGGFGGGRGGFGGGFGGGFRGGVF